MRFANFRAEQVEKVELTLPNGAVLKSRYIHNKGGFWMTYNRVIPGTPKNKMPLVGCLSSGTDTHLFAYDFDELPPGIPSWEALMDILLDLPGFTVARSPSGKVKAFIAFRWAKEVNKPLVIQAARELLPTNLQNSFDEMGAFQFYLSQDIADALKGMNEWLVLDWSAAARAAALGETDSNIVSDTRNNKRSHQFSYHLADEASLPAALEPFINRRARGAEARIRFCRILVAMFRLADKGGFGLPVASLAEACGVDKPTVSAWLSWLKRAGFLSCVSSSYIVGLKAKHYEARGDLLEAIVKRKETYNYATTLPKAPPKDGEFYKYFLHLSKKVPVLRDYKLVIDSIPGIHLRNRYKMAMRIFQCDRRKESRNEGSCESLQRGAD